MIAVALKGLLGRKIRAMLTALAIVLGVGDGQRRRSSSPTRSTRPSTASSRRRTSRHRRRDRGQADRQGLGAANTPTRARLTARPHPGAARRSRPPPVADPLRDGQARRPRRQGDRQRRTASSASASTRRTSASARSALTTGHWPSGPGEIAIGRRHRRRRSTSPSATRSAPRRRRSQVHRYTITGIAEIFGVSTRSAAQRSRAATCAPPRSCSASRAASTASPWSAAPDVTPRCARSADPPAALRDGDGARRRRQRRQPTTSRSRADVSGHPLLPARRSAASRCSSAPSSSSTRSRSRSRSARASSQRCGRSAPRAGRSCARCVLEGAGDRRCWRRVVGLVARARARQGARGAVQRRPPASRRRCSRRGRSSSRSSLGTGDHVARRASCRRCARRVCRRSPPSAKAPTLPAATLRRAHALRPPAP